jgi:hypothetical protein
MQSITTDFARSASQCPAISPFSKKLLDAVRQNWFTNPQKINFEFCICIYSYLCYRVFIPVVEKVLQAGSSLRHWPPGTNS